MEPSEGAKCSGLGIIRRNMYLLLVKYLANAGSQHINGYVVGRIRNVSLVIPHSFTGCHRQ
jgi:hypothetical protein